MVRVLVLVNEIVPTSIPFELSARLAESTPATVTVASFYDDSDEISGDLSTSRLNLLPLGASSRFDPGAWSALHRELKTGDYDVLHTHHNFSGSVARVLGATTSVQIVNTEHRDHESLSLLQNLVNFPTLPLADRTIANSVSTLNSLRWYERLVLEDERLTVIHNGVDLDRVDSAVETATRTEDKLGVISVGRMVPVKNHTTLVRAFASVTEDVPEAELVLVGDGPMRPEVESVVADLGIEDHVRLVGEVPRDRVYELLAGSDVFVLTSLSEGFCVAAVEAMVAGLPVVVSDIDVFHEVVGKSGAYVDPTTPGGVAATLRELLTDSSRREKLGKASRSRAQEKLSLETTVSEYYDLYLSLLGNKS